MTTKLGIIAALCSIGSTVAGFVTWHPACIIYATLSLIVALWMDWQHGCEIEMRAQQERTRERVRRIREQEDFEIWCGLQEERAHRRIMEEVQRT